MDESSAADDDDEAVEMSEFDSRSRSKSSADGLALGSGEGQLVNDRRSSLFNSTTVGARNALSDPRRRSSLAAGSSPATAPAPVVLRKTNGPQQEQEGFDFHDLYPDDNHETEKVDLHRVSLSGVSDLKMVGGVGKGTDDDFDYRRIKSNWKTHETNNPQNVVKPAPKMTVFYEKGFINNNSNAPVPAAPQQSPPQKRSFYESNPLAMFTSAVVPPPPGSAAATETGTAVDESSRVDFHEQQPAASKGGSNSFAAMNPMAGARRSSITRSSSMDSTGGQPPPPAPPGASPVLSARPRRQSSVNTMSTSKNAKQPVFVVVDADADDSLHDVNIA